MRVEFDDIVDSLDQVRDHGRYSSARCVFHSPDNHPSMLVFKDGYYRCLSCGASGGLTQLQRALNGWVPPAVSNKADWHSPLLPNDLYSQDELCNDSHDVLRRHEDPLAWYLKERGIFDRILPQYIGYYNGWYTIPMLSDKKDFLGMVARAGSHIQHTTGSRYSIPHGQRSILYIPDHVIVRDSDYLVAVYGIIDALSLRQLGIPSCTGSSGKDSLKPEMLDEYRKQIIILPDKGEEDTARKLASRLGWRGKVLVLDYPDGCKDPNDLLVKGHSQWLISQINRKRKE